MSEPAHRSNLPRTPSARLPRFAGKPRDWLVYAVVRVVAALLQMFPIELNLRTARLMGWCWYHFPSRFPLIGRRIAAHRRRAFDHLRLALGNAYDEAHLRRLALESMQHWTMLAVEVIQTPRLITPWTWRRYIRLVDVGPAVRVLLDRRGCILITAHYGSFELIGYTLATLGFPITALMRPFDNEYLNHFLLDRRQRSGLTLLYKKGAMARAPQVLAEGGALCFIADQDAGRKGLFVDFFGRPASTYKSIALLAIEHQAPIIVGCARRIGRGFRYEICVNRIIRPQEWHGRPDEVLWITQEYSDAMERFIREAPGQYLWIHRRWKHQPRTRREAPGDVKSDVACEMADPNRDAERDQGESVKGAASCNRAD
ncbi:MAG: lysophospholipid acyltransferase family protein [Phycisphaerae bacterium]|nr:lysophospholipid acyltransferase family protein [Phycisphaerae bacterium]NUQ47720.1 lysophospholipid acyltransferase family protein [Phycisphaerae bacterium]